MLGNKKGFTLIELMIVIGLLGILAAIAIPVYSGYRNNAYRAAAKAALVEGAQNMERYFTRNNTYVGATVGTAATDQVVATTEAGKYAMSLPTQTATTFTILATPAYPDKCGNLSITQTGAKASTLLPGTCW